MKKKIFTLLLASVLTISGCANSNNTLPSSDNTETSNNLEDDSQSLNVAESNADATEESQAIPEFEEITVIDNEECAIKITGIDPDDFFGYTLKAYLENKSSDKTYMFSVSNAAINEVQCDPLFSAEVAAGKKSNNDISFSVKNDIGDFTDIEIAFRVYDSNDWTADAVAEETTHVYPFGKDNAIAYVREPQGTDNTIIDNEYVTVIVTGYEHDDIFGYTANLFLVNKSDKEIMFSANDVSVNGYMMDPFYATSVIPGKCMFSSMSWLDSTFDENGITEVEEIEFTFRAHDSNDFTSDDFANELITLNP